MTSNERERDTEARLRRAMAGHTATVPEPPDRWSAVETAAAGSRRRDHRRRAALAALGLAAAITITVASVVVLRGAPARRLVTTPATGPSGPTGPSGTAPVSSAPTSVALSTSTSTPPPSTPPALPAGLLPVWPFASADGVRVWQDSYRAGGQQPWHLDAGQTALAFTTGYLGFKDITLIVTQSSAAGDAHVAVGSATSAGRTVTAAVIHLVRFGSGVDAPWEVVGTDDTGGLTLTAPRYGSTVTSPISVGGTITGVDENIHVQVHRLSTTTAVGDACCHPAGGTNTPWTVTVSYQGGIDRVVTIVAWTGGHLLQIERFAITALRI